MSKRGIVAGGLIAAVLVIIAAGSVYAVLRYKLYYAPSESMAPTVTKQQMFVVDRFAYAGTPPRRNDVVLFTPPTPALIPTFKRVVAVPGDRLKIRNGLLSLNGRPPAREPYTLHGTPYDLDVRDYTLYVDGQRSDTEFAFVPPRAKWTAPDTVPPGCYVMLGDNRENSLDSHVFGFVCPGQPVPNLPTIRPELIGRAIVTSR